MAESALRVQGARSGRNGGQADETLRHAAAALAPRWEDLAASGLTTASLSALAELPIGDRATLTVEAGFFTGQFAEALAQHPRPPSGQSAGARPLGLLFRNPWRYDDEDAGFFLRAAWEATRAGMPVAVEGSPKVTPLPDHLPVWPQAGRRVPGIIDPQDAAIRLLALCPRGLPLSVLLTAARAVAAPAASLTEDGFDGRTWVWLTPGMRRRVLSLMPAADRRAAHRRLFEAWPVGGWDYLRRAPHAWESGATDLIAAQAVPVAAALRGLGARFALRHMRSLALAATELDTSKGLSVEQEALIWSQVARLLPPGRAGGPSAAALPCLVRALALTVPPTARIERLRELANHHAAGSSPGGFANARRLYNAGFRLLQTIADPDERLRQQVRLLQGLAGVTWQARQRAEALEIEAKAHALVVATPAAFPAIEAWAQPLRDATAALTQATDHHRPDVTASLAPLSLAPAPLAAMALIPGPLDLASLDLGSLSPEPPVPGTAAAQSAVEDTLILRAQVVYAAARRIIGRNSTVVEAIAGLDSMADSPPHILTGR